MAVAGHRGDDVSATVFGETSAQALDEETITEAYVYLLGRALVIRQEHIDLEETGAAYNTIKYNPLGSADFVNPNSTSPISRRGSRWTTRRRWCSRCRKSRAATTPRRSSTSGVRSSRISTSDPSGRCP